MVDIKQLRFFQTTEPHTCSYLPDQIASTLFVDPNSPIDNDLYNQLTLLGFRRSGQHLYRPNCAQCQACIPIRIPIAEYTPSKRFKRILNKNKDLTVNCKKAYFNSTHYALFEKYIEQRHKDGDMYPATPSQYRNFLIDTCVNTYFYEFYLDSQLICISVIDHLPDDLSAIYTFFDPDYSKRSLGSFAILWQIENARQLNNRFLYLGYWVKQCPKMNYKTQYRPLEIYNGSQWIRVN